MVTLRLASVQYLFVYENVDLIAFSCAGNIKKKNPKKIVKAKKLKKYM